MRLHADAGVAGVPRAGETLSRTPDREEGDLANGILTTKAQRHEANNQEAL